MASSCSNSMGNSAYFSGLIWVCDLFSYEVRELTFLLAVRKQHVCNFPYFPSGRKGNNLRHSIDVVNT